MSRPIWATLLVVVVMAAGMILYMGRQKTDRHYNTYYAIMRAERIARACRVYYLSERSEKSYPTQLADLLRPPFGGEPFLNDAGELSDPWGNPYKYAIVPNGKEEPAPFVWAERTIDGHTTLLGARLTSDGTAVRFGLP